jgi:hypothetical protein
MSTNVGQIVGKNWWCESKLVQLLWKTVWRPLKELKIELPYNLLICLLGIYLKKCKPVYNRAICTLIVIAALVTIATLWK